MSSVGKVTILRRRTGHESQSDFNGLSTYGLKKIVKANNGPPKPNVRNKIKSLNKLEGLLGIMGLEVMAKVVRADGPTHSENWRKRIQSQSA